MNAGGPPVPVPILLVDDRPANLLALEAVLGSPGYELVVAHSGEEALREVAGRDFAVVLLDVQMPVMDGFETAAAMRVLLAASGRHLPVIFVTGIDTSRALVLRAYETGGVVDFIQKPLEPEVIWMKVSVFAELHRARERVAREKTDARRHLNGLTQLALALSPVRDRAELARVIVEQGTRAAQADTCTLYAVDDSGAGLDLIGERGVPSTIAQHIRRITETSGNPAAFATWRTGIATWAESDADYRKIFPSLATMKAEGTRAQAFWSVPLVVEGRPVGLLGMGFYAARSFSGEERAFVEAFAQQCAQALLRVLRLERENAARTLEVRDRARSEFLAKAGEALVSSLDYDATLRTVARLAVPALADWCSIHLVEAGSIGSRQVTVAHADEEKVEYARRLEEHYPPDPNATTGAPQVIRSGISELYREIPAALIEAGAKDAEHLRIIRELRLESAMVVPLPSQGRTLGAITFVYAESGRRYDEGDLAFAEDFARRAAMAIQNATALKETQAGRMREQELRAQTEANARFQEIFLGILGHDLRNPLGSIAMSAEVLLRRNANERDAKLLGRMTTSVERMTRMIDQILDLTRSRVGGGLEVSPAPVDLVELLSAVVDEIRGAHPSRVLEVRSPSSLRGTWDRDRLQQVFSNLLGNAVQYGLASAPITVAAEGDRDSSVSVTVHNEGIPIAPDLLAKIFDPFRRGQRDSRSPQTAGLGLGLFISREIVIAHGGTLEVESSAAEGTTFRVVLPRTPTLPA